jgi:hypothetical protein
MKIIGSCVSPHVRNLIAGLALTLGLAIPSPVAALCSGATVEREFREADLVIRARLVSETATWDDAPSAAYQKKWGLGDLVSLYGLKVVEVFKGAPGARVEMFMEHNSGAFYVDMDKDYLLFLRYIRPYPGRPAAARGATDMKYACGQSKPWSEVRARDLARLRGLAAAH